MHTKRIRTLSLISAFAAAAVAVPMAAADGGPPQGGGGCNMVYNPGVTGLTYMMVGSAHGDGAANMAVMLSDFSPLPFCGA